MNNPAEDRSKSSSEFATKLQRLRNAMQEHNVDACCLETQANHAWLGCGAETFIPYVSVDGCCSLIVTADKVYLVADNIEAHRLMDEEFCGLDIETASYPWQEGSDRAEQLIRECAGTGTVAGDRPREGWQHFAGVLQQCRASLVSAEIERYKTVGAQAEAALRESAWEISVGMTEYELASHVAERVVQQGLVPNLVLVGTDERILRYRHPIPTGKRLARSAMLVVCARGGGLIANATRMIHFGDVPAELARRHAAVCHVDAVLNLSSRPGATFGEVLQAGIDEYERHGFHDEWNLHHQGGPTGYAGREFKAVPSCRETVRDNQPIAWNPSITGTKCEDTIIATADGPLVLTEAQEWPLMEVETPAGRMARPDILVR